MFCPKSCGVSGHDLTAIHQRGSETVLIGFIISSGTVTAASDWNGPPLIKELRPPSPFRDVSVRTLRRRADNETKRTGRETGRQGTGKKTPSPRGQEAAEKLWIEVEGLVRKKLQ
jgi:hypothetical protein